VIEGTLAKGFWRGGGYMRPAAYAISCELARASSSHCDATAVAAAALASSQPF